MKATSQIPIKSVATMYPSRLSQLMFGWALIFDMAVIFEFIECVSPESKSEKKLS